MRGRVDGVIVMSPDIDADSLLNMPASLPVVLLCSPAADHAVDSVIIDNFRGAREMVRHLTSLGHKRIAIIKGAAGNYDAAERLRGYRAALREAGLQVDAEMECDGGFTRQVDNSRRRPASVKMRPTAILPRTTRWRSGRLARFANGRKGAGGDSSGWVRRHSARALRRPAAHLRPRRHR